MWARLTSPFPPEALAWNVVEIVDGGSRARLEPAWSPAAVRARFDAQLGVTGWSYSLGAAGAAGVICNLTIQGVTRGAVAAARAIPTTEAEGAAVGVSVEALAELAFSRCARQFGIAPRVAPRDDSYLVDYDAEAGEPLYAPEPVELEPGDVLPDAADPAGGATPATAYPEPSPANADAAIATEAPGVGRDAASSEALAMIERLVDRLKAEGLGKEAARLVAKHHGRSPEEARELYGRLRALLVGKGTDE